MSPPSILRDPFAQRLLVLSVVVRAIAASLIGPGFDEAYYALFAKHLAWGYFDHPPMVAWSAGLGYLITGLWTPLTLRFGSILLFTVALVGFYTLAGRIYGLRAARLAILLPHAAPYFAVGAGAFVIPDNGLIAVWIWSLVVAWRLREGSIHRTWGFVALGILAGLGMLAKYHAVLLPASLVVASIYDRELRSWWADWRLYLALLVAGLVFLPCLIWNANNEWISLALQFGKSTSGGFRLRFDLLGQAVGGQLGYLTPWLAVFLWIGALRQAKRAESQRWLLAFFLVPVVGMTLIGLTRGILPHWTMPGYVAAIILTAGFYHEAPRANRLTGWGLVVNGLLVAIVLLQANVGVFHLNPKSDPTLDPLGWEETVAAAERSGDLNAGDVLFAHRWFSAAELSWAVGERYPVVLIGDRPHMFAWWAPEESYRGRSGLVIEQARYGINLERVLLPRFEEVTPVAIDTVQSRARRIGMTVWRVENLQHPELPPYGPLAARSIASVEQDVMMEEEAAELAGEATEQAQE